MSNGRSDGLHRARRRPSPGRPAAGRTAALLALGLLVIACGSSSEAGPVATAEPTSSPLTEAGIDVCGRLNLVEQDLEDLRTIRLRPANRDYLATQVETLRIDFDAARSRFPRELWDVGVTANRALVELEIGMEDYVTTPNPLDAEMHVLESENAFDRAYEALRDAAACPPFVPRVIPSASPSAAPTEPPLPDPTPFPSIAATPSPIVTFEPLPTRAPDPSPAASPAG